MTEWGFKDCIAENSMNSQGSCRSPAFMEPLSFGMSDLSQHHMQRAAPSTLQSGQQPRGRFWDAPCPCTLHPHELGSRSFSSGWYAELQSLQMIQFSSPTWVEPLFLWATPSWSPLFRRTHFVTVSGVELECLLH